MPRMISQKTLFCLSAARKASSRRNAASKSPNAARAIMTIFKIPMNPAKPNISMLSTARSRPIRTPPPYP